MSACPKCGAAAGAADRFCGECGEALNQPRPKEITGSGAPARDRLKFAAVAGGGVIAVILLAFFLQFQRTIEPEQTERERLASKPGRIEQEKPDTSEVARKSHDVWRGVTFQDVTPSIAESVGLDQPKGAIVANVIADSAADLAGIAVGDILFKIENERIENAQHATRTINSATHKIRLLFIVRRQDDLFFKTVVSYPTPISQKPEDGLGTPNISESPPAGKPDPAEKSLRSLLNSLPDDHPLKQLPLGNPTGQFSD